MKILVPLNNAELLQKYIDAGADEFYIGFHDLQWSEKFGKYADICLLYTSPSPRDRG